MWNNADMKILFFGDVVGRPGRLGLKRALPGLREQYQADLVVANGENAAGGLGIDNKTAAELRDCGVDIITLGDHALQKKESLSLLDEEQSWVIRPANLKSDAPGRGWTTFKTAAGDLVGILNVQGRVFMNHLLDCPFSLAKQIISNELKDCKVVLCDFHAEATSEKEAMARYLAGQVSLVVGTHTHVQTADERIFSSGTAFITDLGMCGAIDGVIGMNAERALSRFISAVPSSYEVAAGNPVVQGIFCQVDSLTGKATSIERIRCVVEPVEGA